MTIARRLHPGLWFLTVLFAFYWLMAIVDMAIIHDADSSEVWEHVEQSWEFTVGYNDDDDDEQANELDTEHELIAL